MIVTGRSKGLLVSTTLFAVLFLAISAVRGQSYPDDPADLNDDGTVNLVDFAILAFSWRQDGPLSDGVVDFRDLAALTTPWLADTSPVVTIQWLGHASVKIWTAQQVVYVDPRNLSTTPHDATIVLVTHSHSDHYARDGIAAVWGPDTVFIAPADVVAAQGTGQVLMSGETLELDGVCITGVPAYNINKSNHPRASNWLGYIVQFGGRRVYCAGDTDLTEEVKALSGIDVAFLPVSGTYAMSATEAAEATAYMKPQLAIPYHWGDFLGSLRDAETFARFAACEVKIMTPDETLGSDEWGREFSLVAHWTLDESAGNVAADSAGSFDGTLIGKPDWRPAAGVIDGALQFDGRVNYIAAPAALDLSEGPFSAFAWIRDGAPRQVVVSQEGIADWLLTDPATGAFGTALSGTGRQSGPLWSQATVSDGDWHRVGLVWDGSQRVLYVDDVEAARDAQGHLAGSDADLFIGADAALEPGGFWSGMIDDVRLYRRAVTPP